MYIHIDIIIVSICIIIISSMFIVIALWLGYY